MLALCSAAQRWIAGELLARYRALAHGTALMRLPGVSA